MWTGFSHFFAFPYFTQIYPIFRATFMRDSCTYTWFAKSRTKLNTKHLELTSYAKRTRFLSSFYNQFYNY